ncbi:MAG: hypothetical protein LBE56_00780 [Tannerella sp.]|jgi:hypothetical protein|nr:hypothetical protein [Tannerella sp.]
MNNLLDNQMKRHAAEIFGNEPLTGHRERFASKLQGADGTKSIPFRKIISYLAVAAVFAGAVFLSIRLLKTETTEDSTPLTEVQDYYSMQLQEKVNEIKQLLPQVNEKDRAMLLQDIESMQREAGVNALLSDENKKALIVYTYSVKIESLEHIKNMLTTNY